jgi:hypothetical protein
MNAIQRPDAVVAQTTQAISTAGKSTGVVFTGPSVDDAAIAAVLARSGAARAADTAIRHCAACKTKMSCDDVASLLERAGVEQHEVKVVLAYHAQRTPDVFTDDALRSLNQLDWSDVARANLEENRRAEAAQVAGFQAYLRDDLDQHVRLSDDTKRTIDKLKARDREQRDLSGDSAFETAAKLEAKAAENNVSLSPTEATLLLLRARARNGQP